MAAASLTLSGSASVHAAFGWPSQSPPPAMFSGQLRQESIRGTELPADVIFCFVRPLSTWRHEKRNRAMTATAFQPDSNKERRNVIILANPHAGPHGRRAQVDGLVEALHRRNLEVCVCWALDELRGQVHSLAERVRCVVAAGGDGTLQAVLNQAPGLPVALLPIGNENLMARNFGIACSGPGLAEIIAAGHYRQLDLMRARGRLVSLMASAGFDAEVVHRAHRWRRGHISKLDYVLPILATLREYRFPSLSVTITETGERLTGQLALVFNVPQYGLGLPIASGAKADDGLLDLYVFQSPGRWGLLRSLGAILRCRHEGQRDVQFRRVRSVRLFASERVVPGFSSRPV